MKKLLKNRAILAVCLIILLSFSSFAKEREVTTLENKDDFGTVVSDWEPKSKMWVDCLSWNTTQYGKYGEVRSLYSVDDVIWAIKTALYYIPSYNGVEPIYPVYTPPATALRQAADAIEKQETDIARIKEILEALKR